MDARLRQRRDASGQALVEFALILPIMLVVVFLAIDMGRAVFAYNAVADAARLVSRAAIVDQDQSTTDCAEDASNRLANKWPTPHSSWCLGQERIALIPGQTTITITYLSFDYSTDVNRPAPRSCSPPAVGCVAEVTVSNTFRAEMPLIYSFVNAVAPDGFAITSVSRLPVERLWP